MFKWNKLGRVFHSGMVSNKWWMKHYSQSPSVLIFEKYVRVFFCCRPEIERNGQYVSYLAYIDLDKTNLLRIVNISEDPILSLGDLGTFDEFGIYPASVINHNGDIRAYYGGNTRCCSVPFNAAIGIAKSYDSGDSFSRIGNGPVLSYCLDEPFVLGSPKIRFFNNKWYLWYSAGQKWLSENGVKQPVYKIRCATSDDGLDWIPLGRNIIIDVLEDNECQASADVTFSEGIYHMFFSYRYNFGFKEPGRGYRMGYAFSDDLIHWKRKDEKIGLETSEKGWDSESVSYAHLFELEEDIYMVYQGNYMGKEGIGLAKLEGKLI